MECTIILLVQRVMHTRPFGMLNAVLCIVTFVSYQGQISGLSKGGGGGGTLVEVTPQCAKHTLRNAKHELSGGMTPRNF